MGALPSPSANSGVSSLHSPRRARGAFGAEGFGRGGCRCLQQGLTPPHPKRPSQPAPGAARQRCLALGPRHRPISLGVTETPRARLSPALWGQTLRGDAKFGAGRCRGGGSGCCVLVLGEGEAEPRRAQRPGGFPLAQCHSRWLSLGTVSQPCLGIAAGRWAAAIYPISTPECDPEQGCAAPGWHGCPRVPLCDREAGAGCQPQTGTVSLSPCRCWGHGSVERRQPWHCQGEHLC